LRVARQSPQERPLPETGISRQAQYKALLNPGFPERFLP